MVRFYEKTNTFIEPIQYETLLIHEREIRTQQVNKIKYP